jgi:hypothetical protein
MATAGVILGYTGMALGIFLVIAAIIAINFLEGWS